MTFLEGVRSAVAGVWDVVLGVVGKATTTDRSGWFADWATGGKTASGQTVSPDSAMRVSPVWACVRVRSEDTGKLDCYLYRRRADGGHDLVFDHPAYRLINIRPNPRMTPYEFRQLMQVQVDIRGNAYAYKEIDAKGQVVALWPLDGTKVRVWKTADGREIYYECELIDGTRAKVPAEFILHVRGLSLDGGFTGVSPVTYHRETIGLRIAAEKYGAAFFGNNAQPMGALVMDELLDQEARDLVRSSWKERHLGQRELAILDGGMKWEATGLSNDDAQYVEVIGATNADIWRMYRMPPHKVGDLDKATFSNIEQQALEYVNDCLSAVLRSWTDTLARDLLTEEEQASLYFEFDTEDLLRGDLQSRMNALVAGVQNGILNSNEARRRLGENSREGGDLYLQPMNMVPWGTAPQPKAAPADVPPVDALPKRLTLVEGGAAAHA